MGLQEQIKKDLTAAMKAKDDEKKNVLRVIMGEFARQPQKKINDPEVIQIVKKLIKSEKEVLERSGGGIDNRFTQIAQDYLPKMATQEEIRTWINVNLDLDGFKNKIQAMGPIMKHFGDRAEGNSVKKILTEL